MLRAAESEERVNRQDTQEALPSTFGCDTCQEVCSFPGGADADDAGGLERVQPEEAVGVLRDARDDPEPLVRDHAAWALGRANR